MKSIVLVIVLLLPNISHGEGYFGRFWRGESKAAYPLLRDHCDDRSSDCFLELINRWLIPATPSYAAKDALMAYAPVLLPKELHDDYHDEYALILYSSEDKYYDLRGQKPTGPSDLKAIEGKTYGPIHGDIFEAGLEGTPESSRSLVPLEYDGKIELLGELKEASYDILGNRGDLVNSNGFFFITERSMFMTVDGFLERVTKYIRNVTRRGKAELIAGYYVLINENQFIEYIFYDNIDDLRVPINQKKNWSLEPVVEMALKPLHPTQTNPLYYERISYGEGGNLQFKPGVKPGQADHPRLHLPFEDEETQN